MIVMAYDNLQMRGDLVRAPAGALASSDDLATPVLLSLFCDADDEQHRLDNGQTRRGWWADSIEDSPRQRWGSRLWALARHGITPETIREADDRIREALRWMVDDGIAASLETEVLRFDRDTIAFRVAIVRPDGTEWSRQWEVTLGIA